MGARVAGTVTMVLLAATVIFLLLSLEPSKSEGSSPIVTATPTPTKSVTPTPTPVPTPTPTPTLTLPAWDDWTFQGAQLTVPSTNIEGAPDATKINGAAITELQPSELVQKAYVNAQGNEASYEAIEPAGKQTLTWDTTIVDGVRYPVGSVLSGSSVNTVYVYCHDYADETALCSTVYDVTNRGDTVTIETPTEVMTFTAQEKFNLRKGELPNDPRVTAVNPGRLVLITCNSGGERNALGETMENSVIVFQLTSSVAK